MRFIGNKQRLIKYIDYFLEQLNINYHVFADIFAGTCSVSKHFKKKGKRIISNDILYFSYLLQISYIKLNKEPNFSKLRDVIEEKPSFEKVLKYLNQLEGKKGYYFDNFSPSGRFHRMYFQEKNSMKIDAILDKIKEWKEANLITFYEEAVLKVSLIEAVQKIANISGTYGAYLKFWEKRSYKDLQLDKIHFINSEETHFVYNEDANKLVRNIEADLVYLDPPYNTRQYISNYHVLESIARDDRISLKGKTGLRSDEDIYKSSYSKKSEVKEVFVDLINNIKCKYILMSYNSEGILSKDFIERTLRSRGKNFRFMEIDFKRFKSNSRGNNNQKVKEYLFFIEL